MNRSQLDSLTVPDRAATIAEHKARTGHSNRKLAKACGYSEPTIRLLLWVDALGDVTTMRQARANKDLVVTSVTEMTSEVDIFVEAARRDFIDFVVGLNYDKPATLQILCDAQMWTEWYPDDPAAIWSKRWSTTRFRRVVASAAPKLAPSGDCLPIERPIGWLRRIAIRTIPNRYLRTAVLASALGILREGFAWPPTVADLERGKSLLAQAAA